MTVAGSAARPHASTSAQSRNPRGRGALLLGLGTAVPEQSHAQDDLTRALARQWKLSGDDLARWLRISEGTGIVRRAAVVFPEQIMGQSTGARMRLYEALAPDLAEAAARRALEHGGAIEPERITDLIVVSCTGFSAPGVDVALAQRLGLRSDVRRTCIGFMGCFGAINGLRAAVGACAAAPDATALVVCVELCSLHARASSDVESQVAAALFADGAAAAVVAGESAPSSGAAVPIGRLDLGRSLLLPRGRDWMSWRITDDGFAMTLARRIPAALRDCLRPFMTEQQVTDTWTFIVHPGGPEILNAAEDALAPRDPVGLDAARSVLARHGNMSSGTVLFVLEEALRRGARLPALLVAFGPGLTVEAISVR